METNVSPRIRIRNHNTGETCTLLNPPRLCKDVLEHLDTTEGWGRGKLTETLEGEVISILVNDQVHAGNYTFREVRASAGPSSAAPGRKKYIGDLTEGINNRSTEAYSSRANTVDSVIDAMDELGAVLVRAPPQSGKTSLLQLVADKLASMGSKVYYVSLGLYDPTKEDSFQKLWALQHPGVEFNDLLASPQNSPESKSKAAPPHEPAYLLVDEAQAAFSNPDLHLFKKMKEIRSGRSKSSLRILLVSCWGSKRIKATSAGGAAFCTPGSWDYNNTIGLWQKTPSSSALNAALQFTIEEAEEYWSGWLAANGWSGYAADPERNYLFAITERQPGALSHLLDCIKSLGLHRLQVPEAEWHRKVQAWLQSEKVIKAVADLRSISMLADAFDEGIAGSVPGSRIPAVAVKDLVRKMLHGGDMKVHTSQLVLVADQYDAALTLTRLGQLILEQEYFSLPSLLHVRYMTRQLYLGRTKDARSILEGGIFEFVVSVVERMDPYQLSESDSRHSPGSALYERQFQNSFYQAAMSYLPHDAVLSPDVGYLYKADGYLDFRLDHPFAWGFELLREGDRRREHLARFASGGKYCPLIDASAVQEWVVLDFCWKKGLHVPSVPEGLVLVSLSEKFTQAVVRSSHKQKVVELRGLMSIR